MSFSSRTKLRRHARTSAPAIPGQNYTPIVHEEEADTDTYGNETRRLGGTRAAFQRPWHRDKRRWVRWPAQAWKVTGQRLVPRGHSSEYRPASHWWSRWLGKAWRMSQRHGGSMNNLIRPLQRSYLNLLLIFLPLALAAALSPWSPDAIFAFNFLAIIPLSGLVYLACEDLSAHLGPSLGRLLVAFSDNLVELLVGIVALCMGEIRLVQLSVIGSALCYSLLIMGSCFVVHGVRFKEGIFSSFAIKSITSLNLVASCFVLIPSTLYMMGTGQDMIGHDPVMALSHGISIILLLLYVIYIFFTLKSHSHLFDEDSESEEDEISASAAYESLAPIPATIWLATSLACVALCTVALLSSIPHSSMKANTRFLGFIIIPFLGNVTDYASACLVALKDQLDITILVTIGSSMQIMLFTWPFLVILGWMIDQPMALNLDLFEAGVIFLGVFVSSTLVRNAKTNYLVGAMCIALYATIALAIYAHP